MLPFTQAPARQSPLYAGTNPRRNRLAERAVVTARPRWERTPLAAEAVRRRKYPAAALQVQDKGRRGRRPKMNPMDRFTPDDAIRQYLIESEPYYRARASDVAPYEAA